MEYALKKYSNISLILSELLNYDAVKHIIKIMKKDELEDARKYHISRLRHRNFLYSQYSFLFSLRGYMDLNKIRKNRKPIFKNMPLELLVHTLTNEEMLRIYDYMLSSPDITPEQIITINKMKTYRINNNNNNNKL